MKPSAIKKIVVLGPESTGKSTLSEALAKYYKTVWVPEFARTYLEKLNRPYEKQDLIEIAKGQIAHEERMEKLAHKLLICDTDLQVIKIWSEFKYGSCDAWILDQIKTRPYDYFLLTDIDLSWEFDPLREHPDEASRKKLLVMYEEQLSSMKFAYSKISGNKAQRLKRAVQIIDQILEH